MLLPLLQNLFSSLSSELVLVEADEVQLWGMAGDDALITRVQYDGISLTSIESDDESSALKIDDRPIWILGSDEYVRPIG